MQEEYACLAQIPAASPNSQNQYSTRSPKFLGELCKCWGMAKRLTTMRIAVHIGAIKLGYFQGESRAIVDPPSTLVVVAAPYAVA